MSNVCPICNRPLCRTTLGDSTDYEQRAKCYRLGYVRERDAANGLAHLTAEQAVIIREVRDRGDAELVNAVLRANGRESARREKAEAENDRFRDLLRRSLDVISPYDTTLWPEIHRAVCPAADSPAPRPPRES